MNPTPTDNHIHSIVINGLHGRMLRLPSRSTGKQNDIVLMYGQHASLERMGGIAEVLSKYGRVTVPDLPGFGGMESFYTQNQAPNIDNFASYLAEFIAREYDDDATITIVAMSFSFLIATRMLQLHPDLTLRVNLMVSFVGFLHHDDFHVPKPLFWLWRMVATLCENRVGAALWTKGFLSPPLIRAAYTIVAKTHPKMKDASPKERKRRIDFEIKLWHINDFRTRMHTLKIMLTADLSHQRVNMPVYHVAVKHDFYFDNSLVEQHMRAVYSDFTVMQASVDAHAPTIISTAAEAEPFIPQELRTLLT